MFLFVNTGILLKLNSERKHFPFGLIRDEKWLFEYVCECVCGIFRSELIMFCRSVWMWSFGGFSNFSMPTTSRYDDPLRTLFLKLKAAVYFHVYKPIYSV